MQSASSVGEERSVISRKVGRVMDRVVCGIALCWLVLFVGDARAQSASMPAAPAAPATPATPAIELLDLVADAPQSVIAGGMLTLRVRLAIALTPPPGVQRPRALREWSAELVAETVHASALNQGGPPVASMIDAPSAASMIDAPSAAATIDHRYPIHVVNVRPETGTSLVYRVQLTIPSWVAPTLYSLRLSGPGGTAERARSVLVRRATDATVVDATNARAANAGGRWIGLRAGVERLASPPGGSSPLTWYPGTSLSQRTVAQSVVTWLADPTDLAERSTQRRLQVTASQPLKLQVTVEPPPRAGQVSTLIARGLPPEVQVAWSLSDGSHALGPARLDHLFRASGSHTAHVLAIAPDGSATSAEVAIQVQPGQRFGCSASARTGRGLEGWRWLGTLSPLILALALLKRRPRTNPGIN